MASLSARWQIYVGANVRATLREGMPMLRRPAVRVAALVPEEQVNAIREALAVEGVKVVHAADPKEAAQTSATVILCDADSRRGWSGMMPEILGRQPKARVILLSRLADERMWVEALNAGAHDLLPNPCPQRNLCSAVKSALSPRWHTQAA
jgi:DNA-binding NtrC family response regulator